MISGIVDAQAKTCAPNSAMQGRSRASTRVPAADEMAVVSAGTSHTSTSPTMPVSTRPTVETPVQTIARPTSTGARYGSTGSSASNGEV